MANPSLFGVVLLLLVCSLAITGANANTYNCTSAIDLAFIVDSSGSICNDEGGPCPNWYSLLNFLRDLINGMTISENDIRVAMIEFETSAYLRWNLTTYKDKASLLNAISRLPFIGGNTDTVAALDMLATVFTAERGDRAGIRNTAVLITDGKPRRGDDPIPLEEIRAAVQGVLNLDIRLLAVGVTPSIDMDTLKEMSSPPHTINETVFVAEDYANIANVLKQLEIQTCINETVPTQSTAEPICTERLDLCFVVDGSGSICDSDPNFNFEEDTGCMNWQYNLDFIRAVCDSFDIGEQATRIGLVIFSTESAVQWTLTTYTDKQQLLDAITGLAYAKGGTTDMTGGLDLMRTQVFGLSDDRTDVPNTAIIITDGYPTEPSTLQAAIDAVRASGIRTLAVGVTNNTDLNTIQRLASQPAKEGETYFLARDYPDLDESVRAQISTVACFTPSPTTPGTTPSSTTTSTSTSTTTTTTTTTSPVSVNEITPTPNTAAPSCNDAALDLCLLVDASGSICDSDPNFNYETDSSCNNWDIIVHFIRQLVDGIFNSDLTRIGIVLFSTESRVAFDLTRYTDKDQLLAAVDGLTYLKGGTTDMTGSLRLARTSIFNTAGDRPDFPNTAVMITDGYPTQPSTLQAEIDATHSSGIRVLALGVTNDVDENTLRRVSSSPQQRNVTYFMALRYIDIDLFRKALQEKICERGP